MKFEHFASGSSGNFYILENEISKILIECGIPFRKIQEAVNFRLYEFDGCLVSHAHLDHCKAHVEVMKSGIDLYMSQETKEKLNANGHRAKVFQDRKVFNVGGFNVFAFPTQHDIEGSYGFLIKSRISRESLLYITDTYYSKYTFKGVTMIAVECNYNDELLKQNIDDGVIHEGRIKRIKMSHFSLNHLIDFLNACDLSEVSVIYLLHLSNQNADEKFIKEEVQKATGRVVEIC